ncbi:MAG: S-methyl-5-thioribose-1-phosphate isomerase [Candidatus Omnitrophica bacterium CG11_big_fil_rev_8_21_14_0_20_45_26]|uniref:Methylthioribose-1-phosphate isomerase n=1 Tax=Candidatus Abzuiibacterium crystallinum TaxID=1974748 RepID=A0A2H0LPN5_9BACT|nr:MAG: S-methyl-5-thioribose-1-phosphate isomerase [Candidatus Omnitrophica bacterium CG11_big_fil_rev_8_21_14_0_20_45_26]PIW63534.1 MAG: S-methyl-5-thioribose-1-phosphate isomerase [Candidatus Omnitrophica bacterium CG12_big_fil_rev_8_21_14_0_65_45_16]
MKSLKFEPVQFKKETLVLIDQRQLPSRFVLMKLKRLKAVHQAIREMVVRGAPAIGITAAYGMYIAIQKQSFKTPRAFLRALEAAGAYLKTSRPTAVNLAWAVDRVIEKVKSSHIKNTVQLKQLVFREAEEIHLEDIRLCFAIGKHGEKLIRPGMSVLTHCNAGGLATSGYGTALSPIFEASRKGKRPHVYVDETRPLLQGARLTAWELMQYKVNATLICDNMAGALMHQGKIKLVITGADRIVRNGDTANKIGTYAVACLAHLHGIPFYVAAPSSTFDFSKKTGSEIPIEKRHPREIKMIKNHALAPAEMAADNPAFDVTPHRLIKGFITEKGILRPPYSKSLKCLQNQ